MKRKFNRRAFIKNSSLGVMAAPVMLKSGLPDEERDTHLVKSYKTLGRTGFQVSDIGIGAPPSEAVLKAALKAGLNYIDTAEEYGNGNNEKLIGNVIKDFERNKIFISTKIYEEGQ